MYMMISCLVGTVKDEVDWKKKMLKIISHSMSTTIEHSIQGDMLPSTSVSGEKSNS